MSVRGTVAHVATIDLTLRFLLLPQLKALQREGYAVAGVSAPGPWTAELEQAGIRHFPIPSLSRGWDPAADARAVAELARLFRRERFDIVHTHMPKSGVLGRLAARLSRSGAILVNTVHGIYGTDPGRPLRRWLFLTLERVAARASDFELCQSREILDLLRGLRILDPDRSAYLGNGIDLTHFDPQAVAPSALARLRAELGVPPGTLVVGTVGRLVWEKGYREFVAAAQAVRRIVPGAAFLAVGPADAVKREALSTHEIRDAESAGIRFLGMRGDMRELYALMDVFVLASYREGFPRSAIEAAAMGKPLILTDISGCREVVTHGVNGFLVPVRQVDPLIEATLTLLHDAPQRARFGLESRRRALRQFDERDVIARLLTLYADLLSRRQRTAPHGLGAKSPAR